MSTNATKRKFNTLLQGLGSSTSKNDDDTIAYETGSTTSPGSTVRAADLELLQKRRRLGFPDSTAPKLGKRANLSATISAIVSRRTQGQDSSKTSNAPPVRYAPSDRGDLLKRLGTFQEITSWTPKPERLNEVEWAKRGWVCHGKETVRCLLCHRELVVKLIRKDAEGKETSVYASSEIGRFFMSMISIVY